MKLLVLAAGYATRLYPLTLDRPKPLLPVAGRPLLEHLLDKLVGTPGLDEVIVVTNAKFAGHFERWAARYEGPSVSVVNDGTTSDETKLGAIGDLALALRERNVADDVIVVAGDNLFSEPLDGFGRTGAERDAPLLAVYDVGDLELIQKYSAIEVDADGRVTYLEEKPQHPRSTLTGIALYYFPRRTLPLVDSYLAEGNNPDQPGRFLVWLYPRTPVYTWPVPGLWYDIGSKESLAEADRVFASRTSA